MKTVYSLFLFLALAAAAAGQTAPTASLNGSWQFAFAPTAADAARLANFYEPGFDEKGFHPIPVPSNWALLGFEEPAYGRLSSAGEGFYVHRFTPPASFQGNRVLLHFGGVWASAEVWLNGHPLGRHDSGFTSFAFDVTNTLKPGGENRLAVRVRQLTHGYLLDTNDDWSLGGIYRDVWLEGMPRARYIERVESSTTFDDQFRDADLDMRVLVSDGRPNTGLGSYDLRAILSGDDGKEVQRATLTIPDHSASARGTGRDTLMRMHVAAPKHWTAETPNLYHLRLELVEKSGVAHARSHSVGFRQVSAAGGVLRVNGQAVKLRGVCRHDENPDVGRATRPEQWLEDLQLMKAANINFVRTSHYPPAEGFIELCDRLGMYVLDEIPMGYGGSDTNDPSLAGGVMLRAYETVARDRNHPSVILWSIGNEDPLTIMHLAAIRYVKGADPTRPLLMPWKEDDYLPPEIDILAPHYRTAVENDQMAGRSWRPVLMTEFTHAFGEDGFGGLEDRWLSLIKHPSGAGGAIWMWQDQGLKRTRRNASGAEESYIQITVDGMDGIVSAERKPQRDYWETKAVYAPVYVPVEKMSFRPGQASLNVPVQNDYDFTDLSQVGIRWRLLADDRELAKGEAHAAAQAHSTASFALPLESLRTVQPGLTYYVQVAFLRADGSEITQRSVELKPEVLPAPAPVRELTLNLQSGKTVVIRAGPMRYEFDPASAHLVSASMNGRKLITGSHLSIWRPLNSTEELVYRRGVAAKLPNLERYKTTVRDWKVRRTAAEIVIEAHADHVVDDSNAFSAFYTYSVGRDGLLRVSYSIQPRVAAEWLPEIGMEFEVVPELNRLRWLGLGPYDAYPDEKRAPILGVWSGETGSETLHGVKSLRWAEFSAAPGPGIRLENCPWVRVSGHSLRALTSVVGRPSKSRRPEAPENRLDLKPGVAFQGSFALTLLAGK